ncbi:MAG TPA: hypothetical protein VEY71_07585 [Chitinophagales bacterium]|nr:hypothetical protein [Chitinophagales bacterium]
MKSATAKAIGSKCAIEFAVVGFIVAYLYMVLLDGSLFWIFYFSYALVLVFAALVILLIAHFIGKVAGDLIIVKKWNFAVVGLGTTLLTLWIGVFVASLLTYFTEGLVNRTPSEAAYHYIYKPLLIVTVWGCIPIVVIGIFFGYRIKRSGTQAARGMGTV